MWVVLPTSCRSVQGSQGSIWESIKQSDTLAERLARSLWWKGKALPSKSWRHASKRAFWTDVPSGMTSALLMGDRGAEECVASWRGSLVSPSPLQASAEEPKTNGGSGPMSSASSKKCSPTSSFSRTFEDYSPVKAGNLSRKSSGTWSPTASTSRQMFFQPETSERPISEKESSSWPSATAAHHTTAFGRGTRDNPTLKDRVEEWQTAAVFQGAWRRQVGQSERSEPLLPAQAQIKSISHMTKGGGWMTPTSRDWKDGVDPSEKAETNGLLGRQGPRSMIHGLIFCGESLGSPPRCQLNPQFVEYLMGLPMGWSNPQCEIDRRDWQRWETQSSHLLRHSLSAFYGSEGKLLQGQR